MHAPIIAISIPSVESLGLPPNSDERYSESGKIRILKPERLSLARAAPDGVAVVGVLANGPGSGFEREYGVSARGPHANDGISTAAIVVTGWLYPPCDI